MPAFDSTKVVVVMLQQRLPPQSLWTESQAVAGSLGRRKSRGVDMATKWAEVALTQADDDDIFDPNDVASDSD